MFTESEGIKMDLFASAGFGLKKTVNVVLLHNADLDTVDGSRLHIDQTPLLPFEYRFQRKM